MQSISIRPMRTSLMITVLLNKRGTSSMGVPRKGSFRWLPHSGLFLCLLDHRQVLLQRWHGFRRPRLQLAVVPALCLSVERGNVHFVALIKPLQIEGVKIPAAEILCFDTASAERDAF